MYMVHLIHNCTAPMNIYTIILHPPHLILRKSEMRIELLTKSNMTIECIIRREGDLRTNGICPYRDNFERKLQSLQW